MKAIYKPKGAAGEYAKYACNFYVGCSNQCTYCYNRKGLVRNRLGGDKPTLCKKFTSELDALNVFGEDISCYKDELIAAGGVFLSFTTDPCLNETYHLTMAAINFALFMGVPITILTKQDIIYLLVLDLKEHFIDNNFRDITKFANIGFTLTDADEMELNASSHYARLFAMRKLASEGFHVWASIEPIITIEKSEKAIKDAIHAGCRDFKIGLLTGEKKPYTPAEVQKFYDRINLYVEQYAPGAKVYWKHSVRKYIGLE